MIGLSLVLFGVWLAASGRPNFTGELRPRDKVGLVLAGIGFAIILLDAFLF